MVFSVSVFNARDAGPQVDDLNLGLSAYLLDQLRELELRLTCEGGYTRPILKQNKSAARVAPLASTALDSKVGQCLVLTDKPPSALCPLPTGIKVWAGSSRLGDYEGAQA